MTGNPEPSFGPSVRISVRPGNGLVDRAIIHSWVMVPDFGPYVRAVSQKVAGIPAEADAGIGFVYVDHHAGISLKIERLCMQDDLQKGGDALARLEELVSLRLRYSAMKTLDMRKLLGEEVKRLGLPAAPDWLDLYNPPFLKEIRELAWLDPFRAPGFFDDVMATLPGIGGDVPELIWIRLVRYFRDPHLFHGILLNEPFRDYGVHRNDTIEIRVAGDLPEITLVAVPCKIPPTGGDEKLGGLPESGGGP